MTSVAQREYGAVLFDLLSALLDSWSLFASLAGSREAGLAWRKRYLFRTCGAGRYRAFEDIVAESAREAGVPRERADRLIERWEHLTPWPEAPEVVRTLAQKLRVGVATNCSIALAARAVGLLGVPIPAVVTAEEAGCYKPDPRLYRLALSRLGCEPGRVLFVAGSPADVAGASAAGMPVYWHNRAGWPAASSSVRPLYTSDSLLPLLEVV